MTDPEVTDSIIIDMWRSGKLVREIAERIGRSQAAVQERLRRIRRRGVDLPERRPQLIVRPAPRVFPSAEVRNARALDYGAILSAITRR